jgi:F-type H+-transporting ATPase subunit delta
MKSSVAAERYAAALYEVAEKQGQIDRIADEIEGLRRLLESEPRLMDFLRSPQIPAAERKEFLKRAFRSLAPLLLRLILLALDKRRIDALPQICSLFQREYDRRRGILKARFVIAKPVGEEAASRLRGGLERRLHRKVQLEVVQNEAIIGGFVFMTETLLIDASIQRQLAEIETSLTASP